MSDVRLKASHGEGATQVTVEFVGKLPPDKWPELIAKLKAALQDYKITDIKQNPSKRR